MGSVDIWINNAGTNGYSFAYILDQDDKNLASVVDTNVLGVIYGSKQAIRVMASQKSPGHIFNMDGAGADGGATPRFAAYGATKRSLEQFNKSLRAELSILKINNIVVHSLSPGMVTTDLLMAGADTFVSKFFINCLAETPETVAEYLVPRIRQSSSGSRTFLPSLFGGEYIRYLTPWKAYGQIAMRILTGRRKDRFVIE